MASASLVQYLTSLPPVTLDRLYGDTWVCHAVLRVLPPVARLYALRLAVVHGALPTSALEAWPAKGREASVQHVAAVRQLRSLRLVQLAPSAQATGGEEDGSQDGATDRSAGDDAPTIRLHRAFADQLITSLGGGPPGLAQDATALHGPDKNAVRADQLERCAPPGKRDGGGQPTTE
jgi:transcription initiation factor TFIIH subunit 4